jgi:hypothetical protein
MGKKCTLSGFFCKFRLLKKIILKFLRGIAKARIFLVDTGSGLVVRCAGFGKKKIVSLQSEMRSVSLANEKKFFSLFSLQTFRFQLKRN